ncbi:importin beta-like protein Kap120p [Monosporozyma servazzii]
MSSGNAHLNEQNIIQILEQASNPQHAGSDVQRLAEQQLKAWEVQPGFHYLLQSIYLDLSNPLQVRWLAVIQFKNGVDKYWRSSRINAIKKDEKASIRARLFDLLDEQNNQLCIQNAQATSKISRLDFPAEWPNLFEHLEKLLENDHIRRDHVKVFNILTHINQIIKTLGTARIGRCKPAMQSKVPLIFPLIVRIYLQTFEEYIQRGHSTSMDLAKLEVSYLALKVLRRMVTEGYERPERDDSVCEFLKLSVTHLQNLISQQEQLGKYDVYEKFIKCYGKLYYTLVTEQPTTFILIPCSTQILITYTKLLFEKAATVYNENSDVTGDFWENVAIRGFLLLKRVVNFVKKKGTITLKARNDKKSIDLSIQKINTEFLNENLVKQLVDILVDWYLKLRPAELESWFCDPEEWMNEQMITSYEYQIRPCAENFFQDLINSFPDLLVPYLLNKIENEAANLTSSLDDFLKKDAIYASFQLSASAVGDMVDFDRLLVDVFLPDATSTNTPTDQLKIIRRRVSLIINEWSTVKSSEKSKSLCFKFFSELLMADDDKVVTLSAVQSLRTMIDDWNFDKDIFEPYLIDITTILLRRVLPSVSLTETRLYVLNTLSDIIIQTKPLISEDLLVEILQIVPKLWEISTNNLSESILSNALLRLLRHLASSLGPKSFLTWEIALPIISLACDPSTSHYALLNEDGFELWGSLLQNYSAKECQFNDKFKELLPFLEYGVDTRTEILPTLLEIVKSYSLILTQTKFFELPSFAKIFTNLSSNLLKLREDSFQLILDTWEILIVSNESNYEAVLIPNFYQTGILETIFEAVFKEESLSTYQCGQLLQIIARLSYVNPDALVEFLSNYYNQLPTSQENMQLPATSRRIVYKDYPFDTVIEKFLEVWIVCFKDIYDPKFKKLHVLGISSLLRTKLPVVLNNFASIVSLWIDIMEEINENNDGDCEKYHLNDIITEQSIAFFPLTSEQFRQHELFKNNDPVHNISLKDFVQQIMLYMEEYLGVDGYRELMGRLNPSLLENLQLFLSIRSSS